ncbi:MAG: serine O-acetyltransferase EpsC [Pseudomonadales bacterium]
MEDDWLSIELLWQEIGEEATLASKQEPVLASFYHATVKNHKTFICALAYQLASKLGNDDVPDMLIRDVVEHALRADESLVEAAALDIRAYRERDPACDTFIMPFLFFKGFQAIQTQRVTHFLWNEGRKVLALYLQATAASVFSVDIHPAVRIGYGVMLDHATGLVAGETSRIGNNVSILHQVTLGGTGTDSNLRHPIIGDGVLLAAGATLLGAIEIGTGAKIAAGSLVQSDVAAHTTVAGVPAKVVGKSADAEPAREMNQDLS